MVDSYSISTPADPNVTLSLVPDESEKIELLNVPYKEAIGCLMLISLLTRPDITYAVNHVAKFCKKPRSIHWTAVKRILQIYKVPQISALSINDNPPPYNSKVFVMLTMKGILTLVNQDLVNEH